MPKFMKLGSEFRFNNNDYRGTVVASADAFHFVIDPRHSRMAGGGLVGAALSVVAEHYASKAAVTCYTGELSQLPPEIVHDSEWPVRQKAGPVLVVPRSAVESVHIPWLWLDNRVYVTTAETKFSTVYNWFRLGTIRTFLAENGWDVGQ